VSLVLADLEATRAAGAAAPTTPCTATKPSKILKT